MNILGRNQSQKSLAGDAGSGNGKGRATVESDIDVALISEVFSGDRFKDRQKIIPLRRNIDSRIEPLPFTPEDFDNGGMLAEDIKKIGIVIFQNKSK